MKHAITFLTAFLLAAPTSASWVLEPHITGYKDGGGSEGVTPWGTPAVYARYSQGITLGVPEPRVQINRTGQSSDPLPPVPLPGAAWLFLSGLIGLGGLSRRRK